MTGTAREVSKELGSVYNLGVVAIPPRLPSRRHELPARIYASAAVKWRRVLCRVQALKALGRPVLIGTRTVADSECLSRLFRRHGVEHCLLNARQDREEAELVARAGQRGQITIATNLAGRGTDIQLGVGVQALGGLHVIIAESNDARRIDRQLAGRCARQGDPGSVEIVLSLEDRIMVQQYPAFLLGFLRRCRNRDAALPDWLGRLARRWAQFAIERRHERIRRLLLWQDGEIQRMLAFTGGGE